MSTKIGQGIGQVLQTLRAKQANKAWRLAWFKGDQLKPWIQFSDDGKTIMGCNRMGQRLDATPWAPSQADVVAEDWQTEEG